MLFRLFAEAGAKDEMDKRRVKQAYMDGAAAFRAGKKLPSTPPAGSPMLYSAWRKGYEEERSRPVSQQQPVRRQ
jgi:hypothetical protein